MEVIPHRPPYRFLISADGITESGGVAVARAPDHPAQLVEVCAQACAATLGRQKGGVRDGVMIGVRRLAIQQDDNRGELRVTVTTRAVIGDQAMFRCHVVDASGAAVCDADLAFAVVGDT
jgi:predicted hotdog family 3-hydroxylacyl-ACP dehydratase